MATRDELLAQAAALDAEAIAAHSDERPQAVLRRQAAELRVQALGARPYPVLICSSCFRLTGWLGADGVCAPELRHRRHASAGWPQAGEGRLPLPAESGPLLRRMRRTLGVGGRRDRARAWLARVEPGETGPVAPEEGWELEVGVKFEQEAPEGPDLLLQEVGDHNRSVWHAESARRVAHAAEVRARHEAAELQRGTSDLLG